MPAVGPSSWKNGWIKIKLKLNKKAETIDLHDVTEDRIEFNVPYSKNDSFSTSASHSTLRFYTTRKHYIPLKSAFADLNPTL